MLAKSDFEWEMAAVDSQISALKEVLDALTRRREKTVESFVAAKGALSSVAHSNGSGRNYRRNSSAGPLSSRWLDEGCLVGCLIVIPTIPFFHPPVLEAIKVNAGALRHVSTLIRDSPSPINHVALADRQTPYTIQPVESFLLEVPRVTILDLSGICMHAEMSILEILNLLNDIELVPLLRCLVLPDKILNKPLEPLVAVLQLRKMVSSPLEEATDWIQGSIEYKSTNYVRNRRDMRRRFTDALVSRHGAKANYCINIVDGFTFIIDVHTLCIASADDEKNGKSECNV
ncbi:hypothetical protein C8J56DRAFT_1042780 [Mycena floridula]|nr:hypothetical protein C8J56DRAFT_1042780 [Mycena floridula]